MTSDPSQPTHVCWSVTQDADGRFRWAHAWRGGAPHTRVVVRFSGRSPEAEAQAVSSAKRLLCAQEAN